MPVTLEDATRLKALNRRANIWTGVFLASALTIVVISRVVDPWLAVPLCPVVVVCAVKYTRARKKVWAEIRRLHEPSNRRRQS